jgi:sec-independent protein translocase protein TatB
MLDVGWTELLVIGALALIVVGPRDLPHLLRSVGKWVGQIKRMAREFQRSMEDAARDTDLANMKELRDLRKDIGSLDFRQQAAKAQSYLKQPLKVEPGAGAKPGQPAPAPEAGAPAGAPSGASAVPAVAATPPQGEPDGPVQAAAPAEHRPSGGEGPEAGAPEAGAPGAKVPGAKVPGE